MNNKTFKFTLLVVVIVSMLLAACAPAVNQSANNAILGSGKVKNETREVSGITSIVFTASGYLTITQGDTESLTVQAEDNILPLIVTEVKDGVLTIGLKDNTSFKATSMVQYTLTVKDLSAIENQGSGYVVINGLTTKDFSFKGSGSGDLKLTGLQAAALTVENTGSGAFSINGSADSLALTLTGSGLFDGSALTVKTATVNNTGSADAKVNASDTLDVTLTGSGNVLYAGSPALTQNVTGSGQVSPLQ